MRPISLAIAIFFALSASSWSEAHARDVGVRDRAIQADFARAYRASATLGDLLARLANDLPPLERAYVESQTADVKSEKLPVMTIDAGGGVRLTSGGHLILIRAESIEHALFTINQHKLDFSDFPSPEERWKKTMGALPSFDARTGAFHRLFLPEAKALVPVLVAAVTAISFIYEVYTENRAGCADLATAFSECDNARRELEKYIHARTRETTGKPAKGESAEDKRFRNLEKVMKAGQCPEEVVDRGLNKQTLDAMTVLNDRLDSVRGQWAKCSDNRREETATCARGLVDLAKKLCLTKPQETYQRFVQPLLPSGGQPAAK